MKNINAPKTKARINSILTRVPSVSENRGFVSRRGCVPFKKSLCKSCIILPFNEQAMIWEERRRLLWQKDILNKKKIDMLCTFHAFGRKSASILSRVNQANLPSNTASIQSSTCILRSSPRNRVRYPYKLKIPLTTIKAYKTVLHSLIGRIFFHGNQFYVVSFRHS